MIFKDLGIKAKGKRDFVTKILKLYNAFSTKPLTPAQMKVIVEIILTDKSIKKPILGISGKRVKKALELGTSGWDQHIYNLRQKEYLTKEGNLCPLFEKIRQDMTEDTRFFSTIFKVVLDGSDQ